MLRWSNNNLTLLGAESATRFVRIQKDPKSLEDPENLRQVLLDFIADFSNWDNSTVDAYLQTSRKLTAAAHAGLGGQPGERPIVLDPFAGGGSIPLEAARVGADPLAFDVNPVAVLLNRLILESLAGANETLIDRFSEQAGRVRARAFARIGRYFQSEDGSTDAYIWARSIRCEGPACGATFPLVSSPWLAKRRGKYVWIEFSRGVAGERVFCEIRTDSKAPRAEPTGTAGMGSASCPVCDFTTKKKAVYEQLTKQQGGTRSAWLLAVVSSSGNGKSYRLPTEGDLTLVAEATSESDAMQARLPNERINPISPGKFGSGVASPTRIGCETFSDLFAPRQLLALQTFADEIAKVDDFAVRGLLACALDRLADYNSAHCRWAASGEFIGNTFGRQAISIVWSFVEVNPFSSSSGNWDGAIEWISRFAGHVRKSQMQAGQARRGMAHNLPLPDDSVAALFTDPPYYGAIMYGDLSDFFYVWLKRSLGSALPEEFGAELVEKKHEIIATPTSKGPDGEAKDAGFFESRMRAALAEARRVVAPDGIGTVVFAHKTTTGWEAMLSALIGAGWVVTASWPLDTERQGRTNAQGSSALGSSVHLVCRPRENPDGSLREEYVGDWRDVLAELPTRVHDWLPRLAAEGVVGADAIFACLGPALEVFSRYSSVEKASGQTVGLDEYLQEIWSAVSREALGMIFEGSDSSGFEEDARLTAMWLWTLHTSANGDGTEEEEGDKAQSVRGYGLDYDAARKIAQGLGAHLENLGHLVDVKGDTATLLSAGARARFLFGRNATSEPRRSVSDKKSQMAFDFGQELGELENDVGDWTRDLSNRQGATVLDQLHQAMVLFGAGRSEAIRRFLVEDGIGQNPLFWSLAQALSALYPSSTEEKRWVDGILARKKGLGL